LKNAVWDSEILGLVAQIHEYKGRQELYLKQKPKELDRLIGIAKIQSTEAHSTQEMILIDAVHPSQQNCQKLETLPFGRSIRVRWFCCDRATEFLCSLYQQSNQFLATALPSREAITFQRLLIQNKLDFGYSPMAGTPKSRGGLPSGRKNIKFPSFRQRSRSQNSLLHYKRISTPCCFCRYFLYI